MNQGTLVNTKEEHPSKFVYKSKREFIHIFETECFNLSIYLQHVNNKRAYRERILLKERNKMDNFECQIQQYNKTIEQFRQKARKSKRRLEKLLQNIDNTDFLKYEVTRDERKALAFMLEMANKCNIETKPSLEQYVKWLLNDTFQGWALNAVAYKKKHRSEEYIQAKFSKQTSSQDSESKASKTRYNPTQDSPNKILYASSSSYPLKNLLSSFQPSFVLAEPPSKQLPSTKGVLILADRLKCKMHAKLIEKARYDAQLALLASGTKRTHIPTSSIKPKPKFFVPPDG